MQDVFSTISVVDRATLTPRRDKATCGCTQSRGANIALPMHQSFFYKVSICLLLSNHCYVFHSCLRITLTAPSLPVSPCLSLYQVITFSAKAASTDRA